MAGTRPLTPQEERRVVAVARRFPARDRLLICLQLFAGFRLLEALALKVSDVWQGGEPAFSLHRPPHRNERHRLGMVQIMVCNELARAIEAYVGRRLRSGVLTCESTLFLTRGLQPTHPDKVIDRRQGLRVVQKAFAQAEIYDDGRLGTHTLRKTFARKLFERSGRDLIKVRDALGHASVLTTDDYVESLREDVEAAILKADWTKQA